MGRPKKAWTYRHRATSIDGMLYVPRKQRLLRKAMSATFMPQCEKYRIRHCSPSMKEQTIGYAFTLHSMAMGSEEREQSGSYKKLYETTGHDELKHIIRPASKGCLAMCCPRMLILPKVHTPIDFLRYGISAFYLHASLQLDRLAQ